MIHANFLFDESLLDCHIKKQTITVKEVELDEIDMEIINSTKRELTLLDKADLLKRIFDYPYREITNTPQSHHFIPNKLPEYHEEKHYQSVPLSINDEKIINKTLNHSYLTLKNKVLKNRCFRQNLINLKRRTQQLLSSGSEGGKMDEEQFQSKVDAAIRNETEKGRVRCPFCPRRCFLKENMRAHLASSHHGDLPYTCNQCDQRFATKDQLVSHHRIHLEAKPFRCSLCDKGFTQLGNLQRHHKIHERRAAAAAAAAAANANNNSNSSSTSSSTCSSSAQVAPATTTTAAAPSAPAPAHSRSSDAPSVSNQTSTSTTTGNTSSKSSNSSN